VDFKPPEKSVIDWALYIQRGIIGTDHNDWLPPMTSGIYSFGLGGFQILGFSKWHRDRLSRPGALTKNFIHAQMLHYGYEFDDAMPFNELREKYRLWVAQSHVCNPCILREHDQH
jgi:hypothetical protein